MKIRLAKEIDIDSIVDGSGLRTVVWTQGCIHKCKGCHNPDTHDFKKGFEKNIDELFSEIINISNQDGVTLSGGDPLNQIDSTLELCKKLKEKDINIWCYTGYTFEELLTLGNKYVEVLEYIDVLVDGKFIEDKKSLSCMYRGSTNQRILDVPKSLRLRKAVIKTEYEDKNIIFNLPTKEKYMYI